jgi:hypothetical protein
MKSKIIIDDFDDVIKAVAIGSIVTLIFTSFGDNLIKPTVHKIIPYIDKDDPKIKPLSFKNVSRTCIEALFTLILFFILYTLFVYFFKKK